MKKLISVLCVFALLIGVMAVGSFGAAAEVTAAQTIIDVKAGDTVVYSLYLADVPEPVVGSDFSIYFDGDVLEVTSADASEKGGSNGYVINPNLDGEVFACFSNLDGYNFKSKNLFMRVTFKAKKAASTHVNYYVRYLFDMSGTETETYGQMITEYTFTCNVAVNGSDILVDAQPELNIEETQEHGPFVNSVNGKSEDADVNVAEDQNNGGNSGNNGNSGGNSGNNNGNSGNSGNSGNNNGSGNSAVPASSDASKDGSDGSSDGSGSTPGEAKDDSAVTTGTDGTSSGSSSVWLWIVIAVIVAGAGAGIAIFSVRSKKNKNKSEE